MWHDLQVSVRSCYMGEVYTDTRCIVCSNGTFSFDPKPATSQCRECPTGAVCYGSTMIVPATGYFQASLVSETMHKCACRLRLQCLVAMSTRRQEFL